MDKSLFTKDYQLFLSLLRAARDEAGISQTELARRLRTTQSFVSKCERGERRLDVVELRQWCQALRVSFPDFIVNFHGRTGKEDKR